MTLLAQIKATQLQLRKDRFTDLAATLSTLIGEAEVIGKNDGNRETTDQEVVAVVKKNINETLTALGPIKSDSKESLEVQMAHGTKVSELTYELKILNQFIPEQLEGTKLQSIVAAMFLKTNASTPKDMGKVMAELKASYEGQYDGAAASKLIKEQLSA